jgi:hypothetical protein
MRDVAESCTRQHAACAMPSIIVREIASYCNEKIPFMYSFSENFYCLSPNFHIHVSVSDFLYSQDWSTYFPAAE